MSKKKKINKKYNEKLSDIIRCILKYMSKNTSKIYNYKDILNGIEFKKIKQQEKVKQSIHRLLTENKITEVDKGKYILNIDILDTLIGVIYFNQSGNAYVKVDDISYDIFIHHKDVKNALQGDTVVILPFHFKGKKLEAFVVDVIERSKRKFVGTFQYISSKNIGFVIFNKRMINTDIFIPRNNFNGAKDGDKVVVRILDWDGKSKNPKGEILEVLGKQGEYETEIHSILAEYGLPYNFPPEVENDALCIDQTLFENEISKRWDIRDILTFTIDPKDAKDFDDALSIRKLENGNWEIGIHIADVTYYVKPGTLLDKEAYERATSIYLVDRVIPMLPEILSNELCSLRPKEDKFTFSVVFEFNNKAEIIKQWLGRTVINSNRRFTYEEVQEIIETKKGDFSEEINILDSFAKIIRKERMKKGSIAFERSEVRFNLDKNSEPIGVYFKINKDANHLVEEFMLLANKKVSEFVSLNQKGKPTNNTFIYRIHDNPDPIKLTLLKDFVYTLGYKINISSRNKISESMNKLLTDIKGTGEENMIETLAMRSMSKAVYSTENIGHYGLSFEYYSHFTSPIRRYPDIIAHRLLQNYLDGGESFNIIELEEKCKHCSQKERIASDAERDSIRLMQVKFMEKHVGETFKGVISGVTEWGIYVEIPENGAEGLIRLRDLTDDSYIFDAKNYAIVGMRYSNTYRLGDKVNIKVVKVNIINKQLDFKLIQ